MDHKTAGDNSAKMPVENSSACGKLVREEIQKGVQVKYGHEYIPIQTESCKNEHFNYS